MNPNHPCADRLHAYLLGDLDAGARAEVAAHLSSCDRCRPIAAPLETALAAYRSAGPPAADEAALGRLLAARRTAPARRPRWATVAMAAAAAASIFMGGFWAGRREVSPVGSTAAPPTPAATPRPALVRPDRDPPVVDFAVADADLLGGRAVRDTTWN